MSLGLLSKPSDFLQNVSHDSFYHETSQCPKSLSKIAPLNCEENERL